ncbi:tumor necrosis factor receptor superfamily member 10D-like [Symphalangus syndactylus]|uniref:tumor necrosis factor receptor superfamily member 10D-like n=1 Tax=Symphalangus syndactylus TaxID=9590 RepID=UPI003004220F
MSEQDEPAVGVRGRAGSPGWAGATRTRGSRARAPLAVPCGEDRTELPQRKFQNQRREGVKMETPERDRGLAPSFSIKGVKFSLGCTCSYLHLYTGLPELGAEAFEDWGGAPCGGTIKEQWSQSLSEDSDGTAGPQPSLPATFPVVLPLHFVLLRSRQLNRAQGQTNKSSCTTTRDTVCQCEKGSFQDKNSPEICRKCRTGCPRGMAKLSNFTSQSDNKWKNESAASSIGKTPAAKVTVTTSLEPPASSGLDTALYIGLRVGAVTIFLLCVTFCIVFRKKIISCLKGICSGGGGGPERVHRVLFWRRSCPSQVPGAEDNARNETLTSRYLQPTQVSEQEIQGQELAEPTGVTVESPEEPQRLLEQAEAKGCQRRRLQVPVNDADSADISTLLDASATLEEGHAKETIQDQLVGSEKLFYEEDEAGSATSCL